MELRTDRLVLRPVSPDDAEAVHRYRGRRDVATYLTRPPMDLATAEEWTARVAGLWETADADRFDLAFAVLHESAVIGDVVAWNLAPEGEEPAPAATDVWVGYAFDPAHQGQGFATEAVGALVDWLFAGPARRIFANCYAANVRSVSLLGRLGFHVIDRLGPEDDEFGKGLASVQLMLSAPVPATAT